MVSVVEEKSGSPASGTESTPMPIGGVDGDEGTLDVAEVDGVNTRDVSLPRLRCLEVMSHEASSQAAAAGGVVKLAGGTGGMGGTGEKESRCE